MVWGGAVGTMGESADDITDTDPHTTRCCLLPSNTVL